MRILWASNAPWAPTGYGVQTALVTERLRDAGHEVAIASNFGLQGASIEWEGMPVLPSGTDTYSNDILPAQYIAWMGGRPGWLVTLYDVWVFKASYYKEVPIASWTPVDHYPVPPGVVEWAKDHETIAMSRYGQEALADKKIQSTYIPHGVSRVFSPGDKAESRKTWASPTTPSRCSSTPPTRAPTHPGSRGRRTSARCWCSWAFTPMSTSTSTPTCSGSTGST